MLRCVVPAQASQASRWRYRLLGYRIRLAPAERAFLSCSFGPERRHEQAESLLGALLLSLLLLRSGASVAASELICHGI